jgi:hypothetical protein
MKARNKEKLKILIYSIILVVYILGFVLIFNYKQILGIGYYQDDKKFTTTYSGGTGGVDLEIYALHIGSLQHYYGIEITAFSSTDSHLEGITYLYYRITTSVTKKLLTTNYSSPITTYSIGYYPRLLTNLRQDDNLSCKGFADIAFKVNDINEIHRVSFEINVIILMDGDAINYNEISLTWINVIYLGCTAIPLAFLLRSVRSLRFLKWYSDDIRERDEHFHEKLKNKEESLSNKNI